MASRGNIWHRGVDVPVGGQVTEMLSIGLAVAFGFLGMVAERAAASRDNDDPASQ